MFEKLEIRKHTYSNKASILHIDRVEEFKRKLKEKHNSQKKSPKNQSRILDDAY